MFNQSGDSKKAILKLLEQLYDDVEANRAFVINMNIENGHQEVTTVGDSWAKYIPTGRQTISLEIERNV